MKKIILLIVCAVIGLCTSLSIVYQEENILFKIDKEYIVLNMDKNCFDIQISSNKTEEQLNTELSSLLGANYIGLFKFPSCTDSTVSLNGAKFDSYIHYQYPYINNEYYVVHEGRKVNPDSESLEVVVGGRKFEKANLGDTILITMGNKVETATIVGKFSNEISVLNNSVLRHETLVQHKKQTDSYIICNKELTTPNSNYNIIVPFIYKEILSIFAKLDENGYKRVPFKMLLEAPPEFSIYINSAYYFTLIMSPILFLVSLVFLSDRKWWWKILGSACTLGGLLVTTIVTSKSIAYSTIISGYIWHTVGIMAGVFAGIAIIAVAISMIISHKQKLASKAVKYDKLI